MKEKACMGRLVRMACYRKLERLADCHKALRSQDWDSHEVKEWRSYTFVIIGHDSSAGAGSHDGAIDHANRIRQSRAWTRLSKFGVVEMTFGNGSTPQILTNRINALMAGKNSEDLIFFYFRGRSFGTNEEYRWLVVPMLDDIDGLLLTSCVGSCPVYRNLSTPSGL